MARFALRVCRDWGLSSLAYSACLLRLPARCALAAGACSRLRRLSVALVRCAHASARGACARSWCDAHGRRRKHTRRCWLGDFFAGRDDFKSALLLDPNNKALRDDVEMLVTTTGAAKSLSEFMGAALPNPKSTALAALEAAGVRGPV
jgi:hypothetical protein